MGQGDPSPPLGARIPQDRLDLFHQATRTQQIPTALAVLKKSHPGTPDELPLGGALGNN